MQSSRQTAKLPTRSSTSCQISQISLVRFLHQRTILCHNVNCLQSETPTLEPACCLYPSLEMRAVKRCAAAAAVQFTHSSSLRSVALRRFSSLKTWATLDADKWDAENPFTVQNLVNGEWRASAATETVIDPLTGGAFLNVPATRLEELAPFVDSLNSCPKTGLHNPYRNVERYLMLGRVSARAAACLRDPAIHDFFTRLIQRVSPKSYAQAAGEVTVSAAFFENFSGDNVRYLARSFGVSGDHSGQVSVGHRFPFGGVAIITPYNFPIEIPVLQVMGALYMGNKPVVKVDSKVSVVFEQFLRMLHAVGLPTTDVDLLNCDGPTMNKFLMRAGPRNTLFTGEIRVVREGGGGNAAVSARTRVY